MMRLDFSARTTKLAGALLLALAAPFAQGATGLHNNIDERLLAGHNRERTALGIAPLQWDAKLAQDAAAYAQQLVKLGYLEHYEGDFNDPDPQGENLWAGTRGYYGPESMVGLWLAEKKDFKQGVFPSVTRSGDLDDVGHYTQMVWRSSHSVGCAMARGAEDDFLVCRYSEGGNVIGERVY